MAVHATSEVSIPADGALLEGDLAIPDGAVGLVAFAHGSGSSRHSPRNTHVAGELNGDRLATLLFDLLTPDEEEIDRRTGELRFDIDLLGRRLVAAVDWLSREPATRDLPTGCFGASTGAAAALVAAASRPAQVVTVVSRGGRPDLAAEVLAKVTAPTLMIVGGNDPAVIEMNQQARRQMLCETALEIVPGAGHLFSEEGALERVVLLARMWFLRWLPGSRP